MEIRPLSAPGPLLAGLAAEAGLMTGSAGAMPGAGAAGAPDLLAGLNSPLAAAGLLAPTATPDSAALAPAIGADSARMQLLDAHPAAFKTTMAATLDTPATPLADSGRLGMPAAGLDAQAAQPLAPAWVTALHTPALRQSPWPDPQAPVRQREQQRRQQGFEGDADEAIEHEAAAPGHVPATFEAVEDEAPALWPAETLAQLPAELRAELARRRAVLLVAPPGPGQRGLQLVCLGFGLRGQPLLRRWAVRGADAATAVDPRWHLWRVRREGEDGQRPVLTARALSAPQRDVGGLMLRVSATVLPAPLRPANHAWLDVLEPQRLWRDLGSQWTLLLAWAPHPLHWGSA